MIIDSAKQALGVVARNSVSYVGSVFEALEQEKIVVSLRSENDDDRISVAGVNEIIVPNEDYGWAKNLTYPMPPVAQQRIAQVLFSSGTEGLPKAILLSKAALDNTTDRLISVMRLTSEVREYIGVPVFYSFGFGRCRAVARVGGEFYIPPQGFDPAEISSMLESGEINALSAVPSLWRILLSVSELFEGCGEKMRWIEIGSQYMSRSEKEHLKEIFPRARIVQHYGLTEASRSTFLAIDEVEGEQLESVGEAVDGVEIQIGDKDQIKIRGPHLASGLIADNKTQSILGDDGWFTTADTGYIENGFLYYTGRSDDLINCGGVKLSPDLIEQYLYKELGIDRGISVAKIEDKLRGEVPLVCYTTELGLSEGRVKQALRQSNQNLGLQIDGIVKIFECEELPRTETGKVQRRELSAMYFSSSLEVSETPDIITETSESPELETAQQLRKAWADVLNIDSIGFDDSFFDLGGDSLSVIRVSLQMEKLGFSREISRKIFEGKTISEIAAEQHRRNESLEQPKIPGVQNTKPDMTALATASQSINVVRGLLVLMNVAAHWVPGIIARLPNAFSEINRYFAVFYSSGTPGFSIIFGAGVGFFFLPRFKKDAFSVGSVLKRNLLLLAAGISCLALVKVLSSYAVGQTVTGMNVSNAFWSVLTFYFYAVLTLYPLLWLLCKFRDFSFSSLALAIVFYSFQLWLDSLSIPPSENPLAQHFVLVLTAKYSYFEMMAGVLIGAAVGKWFRDAILKGESLNLFVMAGILLIAIAAITSIEMGDAPLWTMWPKGLFLWSWPLYLGMVLLCMVFINKFLSSQGQHASLGFLSRLLSIVGLLAFPVFISHAMVIPAKDLFSAIGVPYALPLTVTLFFVCVSYSVYRLFGIYYGNSFNSLSR